MMKKYLYTLRFFSPAFMAVISLLFFTGCEKDQSLEGMVLVDSGTFRMGSSEVDETSLAKEFGTRESKFFENAKPIHEVSLKLFYIDKYEVTNRAYKRFVDQTVRKQPPNWTQNSYWQGRDNHPVNAVSWFDANAFCTWSGKRLPTEQEWERAAQGPEGNQYPWGKSFDKTKGNFALQDTAPVGSMTGDVSGFGVFDMGGNVTEWTSSWYKPYPGSNMQSGFFGETHRVVKGATGSVEGHYNLAMFDSRTSFRGFYKPDGRGTDVGFRCAKNDY